MVQHSFGIFVLERWTNSQVFWLLPAFLLAALSFGSTMAPKINLYSSLACEDYYSERSNLGFPGPLPGGAYPIIEIGQPNPDCHLPEVAGFRILLILDTSASIATSASCKFMYGINIRHYNW
jgi:hypothetical protein